MVATARSLEALNTLAAAIEAVGGPAPLLLAADFARDGGAERLAAEAPRRDGPGGRAGQQRRRLPPHAGA